MLDPIEFGKSMANIVREAMAPLHKRIEELEARAPVAGPKGDPGENGRDADPVDAGAIADAVIESLLTSDRIDTLIDLKATEAVTKHFEANPVLHGKDGKDGQDGLSIKGEPGERGRTGKSGAGIADLLIDRAGELVATFTDGRVKSMGVVVGKDGERGKDGADFTNVELEYDGERTITIRGAGGDIVKHVPIPLDRGYWREGMKAEKGDILTHDGNAWMALRETAAKPCVENKDCWRLFARKGRDGRDGIDAKPIAPYVVLDGGNG